VECVIIPVITGIVTKGLKEALEAILGKHSTDSVRKTTILGTSRIKRIVLPERWGSQLFQEENYQEEKVRDKKHGNKKQQQQQQQ
jgi:hypothetical protein